MKLIYEDLISRLSRKRSIEKISDNEFIIKTIESTGQKFKLIVLKSDKKTFKDQLKYISEEIEKGHKRSEKIVTQFGIVFSPNYIIFLRPRRGTLAKKNVEKLKKDLNKISYVFYKKFEKVIKDPRDFSIWDNLWDRSDIIEEFYRLYFKAKEKLLKDIKGIYDDVKKEDFADNLLVQLLIIWYLQEKGFLNNDNDYLISRFKDYKSLGFDHYYSFLQELFKIMMQKPTNGSFNDATNLGKIVVTGTAPFINGEFENLKIEISDNTFYIDGETEKLKKTDPKNISSVSILNLFKSRDWTEGNIDNYVLGAIYEKLISNLERKKSGTYYTPEEVTSYISHFTIDPYLTQEINKTLNKDFNDIDEIFHQDDEGMYEELFKILKKIKILDPAVGSAHFLESSINHLVKIYLKIISKLKKVGYKSSLEILVADESGELERINIFEIDNKETLQLYLKFYIILSRNVYGVDINPSALKIARARLFLSMAKHFDVNKNIFIQFPNVHFNIREGNSLIGYVDLAKKVQKEQKKIDLFLKADEVQLFQEKIAVVSDLKDFLSSISVKLGIKFEIVDRIEDLNKILNKNQLEWEDFTRFLRIKDNLIKILIVSLNSSQARPLNDLINNITKLFKERLDNRYAKNFKINISDLKKINTFHWIFEFPDVFLKKKGFDIIIGNPPFIRIENIDLLERNFYKLNYSLTNKRFDIYFLFYEVSKSLIRENGYLCFVSPNKFLKSQAGEALRKFITTHFSIKEIINFNNTKVFPGSNVNILLIFLKKTREIDYFPYISINNDFILNSSSLESIDKYEKNDIFFQDFSIYNINGKELDKINWEFLPFKAQKIISKIEGSNSTRLEKLCTSNRQGIVTSQNYVFIVNKELIKENQIEPEFFYKVVEGKEIRKWEEISWNNKFIIYPYRYDNKTKIRNRLSENEDLQVIEYLKDNKKLLLDRYCVKQGNREWFELHDPVSPKYFLSKKIMFPDISQGPNFSIDITGEFFGLDTTYSIIPRDEKLIFYLMAILNSLIIEFYIKFKFQTLGSAYRFKTYLVNDLPIQNPEKLDNNTLEAIISTSKDLYNNYDKKIERKLNSMINDIYHIDSDEFEYIKSILSSEV